MRGAGVDIPPLAFGPRTGLDIIRDAIRDYIAARTGLPDPGVIPDDDIFIGPQDPYGDSVIYRDSPGPSPTEYTPLDHPLDSRPGSPSSVSSERTVRG